MDHEERQTHAPAAMDAGPGQSGWGGRLPLLAAVDLTEPQQALRGQLQPALNWAAESGFSATTDDGCLIGPFNVFLHAPEIAQGYNSWVDAERAHTSLAPNVREIVILTVGAEWDAAYETYAHTAVARSVGVSEAIIDAVRAGTSTDDFTAAQRAAHSFTYALVRTKTVDPGTYQLAETAFGRRGVIDLVHLIGIYLATSALLNAFDVPAPPSITTAK
jgi:4-carboxymuconolactone decarboxylase